MPYQVYSNPNLAAQLRVQGGQDLAHGITAGVAQFMHAANQAMEEQKSLKAQAKAVEMFVTHMPEADRPVDLHTLGNWSSEDKVAFGKGLAVKQAYDEHRQISDERAARLRAFQAEQAARQTEQANQQRQGEWMRRIGQLGTPPEQVPAPLSNEEFDRRTAPLTGQSIIRAAGEANHIPDLQHIAPLLRALTPEPAGLPLGSVFEVPGGGRLIGTGGAPHFVAPGDSPSDLSNTFEEDPLTGQRFLTRGKQVLPSGINPERNREPVPQFDENGILLGHVIHTGGRTGVFQRAQLPDTLTAAQRLNALNGQYRALVSIPTPENKKLADDVHKEIQKLMTKPSATPSAPAASTARPPMPNRGDIQDGYRYLGGGRNPADPTSWKKVD